MSTCQGLPEEVDVSDEEREEMLAQLDELLRVLRSGMASMGRIDAAATRIEKAMAQRQRTALAQIRAALLAHDVDVSEWTDEELTDTVLSYPPEISVAELARRLIAEGNAP